MSINRNISVSILLIFIITSCAKVSSPSGGPEDKQPPVVLDIYPENESINFEEKSFEVTFDEYFILDNVDQVLMVSPPLIKKPVIKARGKKLIVELDKDEELNDNMTYTFNFLNSIKDLNENNPLENFKYVFSTGNVIDSLSVTGYIFDSFTLEAGEEILVLLHSAMADSVPETLLPAYVTRASGNGKFRIDNIVEGEYKIYGLKDDNNNKKYDLATETFAFLDSSIYVSAANNYIPPMPDTLMVETDSTLITPVKDSIGLETRAEEYPEYDSLKYERIPGREYELYYFIADNKIQYLTGADRSQPYLLQFTFSLPVDTALFKMQFADTEQDVKYIREVSTKSDTFKVWLTDSAFYSRELITVYLDHPETDTLGQLQSVMDTVNMRYRITTRGRGARDVVKTSLPYRTNLSQSGGLRPEQMPAFVFDTPVLDPDTSLIRLYLKSDTILNKRDYIIYRDSLNSGKFNIETLLVPDSSYVMVLNNGAFKNIYSHTNDSTSYNFKIRNPDQFGKLTLNITGFIGDIIVQLMDSGENIVREKKISLPDEGSVEFLYLDSKEYIVRIIFDIDRNGEWTTGDYKLKRQPEPVTYYPGKIGVKEGWEMIEDWEISGLRKKDESVSTTRGNSVN